jgi:CheY-like chemotaxis protein
VVREMDDLLRRALGETIEIETIVGGGLWTASLDRNQFENVLLNLAVNARDAMNGEGKLTIELGNAMLDDYYSRHHADVTPGQYVMFAISDTGSGMLPDILEQVFEPFFTTKPEAQGTGLGLSMVHGFVKQSGGHIKVYSEVGEGTTFKIYLPRVHELEVQKTDVASKMVEGGTETILLVEDDPAVQTIAVDTLSSLGYKVLKAVDGQSALSILHSGVWIDLLFTDVVMPGPVRSPDLAMRAKAILPKISVLFTSGYTQNAIVHGGRLDPGVESAAVIEQNEGCATGKNRCCNRVLRRHSAPNIPSKNSCRGRQPRFARDVVRTAWHARAYDARYFKRRGCTRIPARRGFRCSSHRCWSSEEIRSRTGTGGSSCIPLAAHYFLLRLW